MITHTADNQLERAQSALHRAPEISLAPPPQEPPSPLESFRLFSATLAYSPSYDDILRAYVRNFTHRNLPKAQPLHALNLEVILSPQQSATGGNLPISVPIFDPCPECEGTGQSGFFSCDACSGRGMIETFRQIDILIPARLKQEMIIPVSLRHLGITNTYLNVRIRPSTAEA